VIAQTLHMPTAPGETGVHLFFRRLPDREQREGLLAVARGEPTPAARRKAFVAGTLCTPDGSPLALPPGELARLDAMGRDAWDDALTKAAHLNGFAPLQVVMD
jgi:hypothetical protein